MIKSKNLTRIIALAMMLIICFGSICGCSKTDKGNDKSEVTQIKESKFSLVENGVSNYTIVTAENPMSNESIAAEDLQKYFKQATGVELAIKKENQVQLTENSSLLIIGRTQLLESSNIEIDEEYLGPSGFMIKRKGSNLFLCGSQDFGSVYAVQEFLNLHFGFEVYEASLDSTKSEIYIDTNVKNKKLLDLDMTDKPDVPYRQQFGKYFGYSNELGHQMRFTGTSDAFIRESEYPWHNTMRVLPPSIYNNPEVPETYHPKWYINPDSGEDGNQISVTANGDEEELKLLRETILEKLIAAIEVDFAEGKYSELIGFMQQDNGNWQEGESMEYFKERYGAAANAASLIYFINPIAKALGEYMEENHPGRKMSIVIFAYWQTLEAPVIATKNGYEPMSDNVRLEDNVSILYAPIEADYTLSFYHENNALYLENMNKWASLTTKINFWIYSTYFHQYLMMYDNFNAMQENMKIFLQYNPTWIFNESRTGGSSGFHVLKEYLMSKLMWDVDVDLAKLTDNFFKNYYKNAGNTMKELYYAFRTYLNYLKDYKGLNGKVFLDGTDAIAMWPQKTIESFMAYIEKAYQEIEPLKETDIGLYNKLRLRIKTESMVFEFLKLKNYPNAWFSVEEYNDAIDKFIRECNELELIKLVTDQTIQYYMLLLKK